MCTEIPSANLEGHLEAGMRELGLKREKKGIFVTLGFLRIKGWHRANSVRDNGSGWTEKWWVRMTAESHVSVLALGDHGSVASRLRLKGLYRKLQSPGGKGQPGSWKEGRRCECSRLTAFANEIRFSNSPKSM